MSWNIDVWKFLWRFQVFKGGVVLIYYVRFREKIAFRRCCLWNGQTLGITTRLRRRNITNAGLRRRSLMSNGRAPPTLESSTRTAAPLWLRPPRRCLGLGWGLQGEETPIWTSSLGWWGGWGGGQTMPCGLGVWWGWGEKVDCIGSLF